MTSPYLDQSRPTRKLIEELIAAREAALAKGTEATRRQRIERDLTFLREELVRIDGSGLERVIACNPMWAMRALENADRRREAPGGPPTASRPESPEGC